MTCYLFFQYFSDRDLKLDQMFILLKHTMVLNWSFTTVRCYNGKFICWPVLSEAEFIPLNLNVFLKIYFIWYSLEHGIHTINKKKYRPNKMIISVLQIIFVGVLPMALFISISFCDKRTNLINIYFLIATI